MRFLQFVIHTDLPHFFGNDLEGHDHVRKDDLPNLFPLIQMKALGVDDPHLLQDGRFA